MQSLQVHIASQPNARTPQQPPPKMENRHPNREHIDIDIYKEERTTKKKQERKKLSWNCIDDINDRKKRNPYNISE